LATVSTIIVDTFSTILTWVLQTLVHIYKSSVEGIYEMLTRKSNKNAYLPEFNWPVIYVLRDGNDKRRPTLFTVFSSKSRRTLAAVSTITVDTFTTISTRVLQTLIYILKSTQYTLHLVAAICQYVEKTTLSNLPCSQFFPVN